MPLCVLATCAISPRPEAFLLAPAVPFGLSAILGVSSVVLEAALLYDWINPMGTTLVDASVSFSIFLASCWLGSWFFHRKPSLEAGLVATGIVTTLVTLLRGTYDYGVKGGIFPEVYVTILGEAVIPINIAGALFLSWPRLRRVAESPPGVNGQ